MISVLIIGPALLRKGRGNRRTAVRWGRIFAELGHGVIFADLYDGQDCDLLVALHAIQSAPSIERFRSEHPDLPVVLALTGTDIYGLGEMFDQAGQAAAHAAMEQATRLVAFHPLAIANVPEHSRPKVKVILQGALPAAGRPARRTRMFEVAVVGELREVKDPFRTALAARRLPSESVVRVVHAGAAGTPQLAERAAKEEEVNARYTWLGEISHADALSLIARCRLLSISSRHEGGSNVLAEALAVGTPIVASRIPGTVGLLGEDYPGYFEVGDAEGLSALLRRAETDRLFHQLLGDRCRALAGLASPAREVDAWKELLATIL
jgi:putative glycosyltransferase (TIGR04348 family)